MTNVLIVEDEQAIRRFLRTALEGDGMRIFEAETLQRGLLEAATRKARFDYSRSRPARR